MTLFDLETQGAAWSRWAGPLFTHSSWEREADPPGGVGAVRKVGRWPQFFREETLEYQAGRRHVYRFVGPHPPVKDYQAEVTFTPLPDGRTHLRWKASFTPSPIPGLSRLALVVNKLILQAVARRLVRAGENGSGG